MKPTVFNPFTLALSFLKSLLFNDTFSIIKHISSRFKDDIATAQRANKQYKQE
ncbi:MAG: hypothetical protein GX853_02045 [Chloroflexi bacterium]|nr:hypothetical protein [Chloroflexota bacterium]